MWIHGAKVGSKFDTMLDDASVLLSVLIQIGFDTNSINAALGRVENGERASIIGVMADFLHDEVGHEV